MMKAAAIVAILFGAAGCATQVDLVPTGGSRADATVELSYEAGDLQQPIVDERQGEALASRRCNAWGYTGAEPFGGTTRRCVYMSGLGCARWSYTKKYQCLGTGSSQRLGASTANQR
jgi:hypothetical protein